MTCLNCILMHRRIAVAELDIDDVSGVIQKTNTVFKPEHLPIGILIHKGTVDRAALNAWWADRSIPASRSGIREALETLDIASTKTLPVRNYGLSLSDQYWICPVNSHLTWERINYFQNDFSEDIGDVLFGVHKNKNVLDFSSPDNTSDGNLKKRWKMINGKRCLLKGGSNPYRQQPLNEVIASEIMDCLDIAHVPYTVIWEKGAPYSVCEDFVDDKTDLVPAWRIFQSQKRSNSTSVYQHFVDCCAKLGIRDVTGFLDRMIVLDYIIANEDRHLNNFGALRNAETLEWIGMSPVYDSGSSLGYDKIPAQMRQEREIVCKPFKNHHEEQLRLVSSYDWINFDRLSDVKELIADVLSVDEAKDYMDANRIRVIIEMTQRRIEHLKQIALTHHSSLRMDSTKDDVVENIAKAYGV
ncbi:MAG: HipA domain-containing protein [Clostridiales bacterium]|nr:HipA domain-containing protein [Clostridiales bacterium]